MKLTCSKGKPVEFKFEINSDKIDLSVKNGKPIIIRDNTLGMVSLDPRDNALIVRVEDLPEMLRSGLRMRTEDGSVIQFVNDAEEEE